MRYTVFAGLLACLLLVACGTAAVQQPAASVGDARVMTVYKSPSCGCCTDWVAYLEDHGYDITVEDVTSVTAIKEEQGIPRSMHSCHTAMIDGYLIEGHVPFEDIEWLLTEQPDVAGIAVPGMPVGSPGMEVPGTPAQPYDVVAFDEGGTVEVFSSYHR